MTAWPDLQTVIATGWVGLTTLSSVASALDAALPQPGVGSNWTTVRKAVAKVALNISNARNLVQPGSVSASIVRGVGGISKITKALATDPTSSATDVANAAAVEKVPVTPLNVVAVADDKTQAQETMTEVDLMTVQNGAFGVVNVRLPSTWLTGAVSKAKPIAAVTVAVKPTSTATVKSSANGLYIGEF